MVPEWAQLDTAAGRFSFCSSAQRNAGRELRREAQTLWQTRAAVGSARNGLLSPTFSSRGEEGEANDAWALGCKVRPGG